MDTESSGGAGEPGQSTSGQEGSISKTLREVGPLEGSLGGGAGRGLQGL